MQRRKFAREFKLEAVGLISERGVSVAQAARDLDVHENMLRKWVKEIAADPGQSFPGDGRMKPDQLEIERLRREVAPPKRSHEATWRRIGTLLDAFSPTECRNYLRNSG